MKDTTMRPLFLFFFIFVQLLILPLAMSAYAEEASAADTGGKRITDYIEFKPDFVTNIGTPGQKLGYLKAAVTLRASEKTTRAAVEAHMPRLRHVLVMLFAEQTDAGVLTSTDGQAALREEAKSRLNAALTAQQTGEQIESVLFTTFVVQG